MNFRMEFWMFWMCFINVLFNVINNLKFTNAVLSKMTCRNIYVSWDGALCAKEMHRLGPMGLKIYSLERNPWLWLNSWQKKSQDFRQNYLCEFHLRICFLLGRGRITGREITMMCSAVQYSSPEHWPSQLARPHTILSYTAPYTELRRTLTLPTSFAQIWLRLTISFLWVDY